jgi:type IV pilus assembly protein PilP
MRRGRICAASLAVALALASCGGGDDDRAAPPPKPPASAGAAKPATPATTGAIAPLTTAPEPSKEALLAEVRKRQLTNEDFAESDANRDPFRSYLSTFGVEKPTNLKQHKIVLEKFALDELKLAGISSGDEVAPRAMFVDPSGMGVFVKRGDHVSKADALVVRIAPDRVFFQIEEEAGAGKTRTVERVIELHAGELTAP